LLDTRTDRDYKAALLFVIATLCVAGFLVLKNYSAPLIGDYSEWSYHGLLLRDVLQGHPDSAYVLKNYPVPNSFTTVVLGLLMLVMPWKAAAMTWLLGEVALGLWAALELLKASGRGQGWQLLLLPPVLLLGLTYWSGFTNFNCGVYFSMLFCALLLRGAASDWLYGTLLLAIFFSHMIPFGFAVLVLGLYAAQERRWRLLWQTVPSFALSIWYFIGLAIHNDPDAKSGMVASVPYGTPAFVAFKINGYLKSWGFVNPAYGEHDSVLLRLVGAKIFTVLFLLNAGVALIMLALLAREAWKAMQGKTKHRFFWGAMAIFYAVALVMPGVMAGVSDPGGRMMRVAASCGLCMVGLRSGWARTLLGGCALGLLLADLYLLGAVSMNPPMTGTTSGPLPARVRQFAHVYYADRWTYGQSIDEGKRDLSIFPTAMFLQK
jgi:hypothetical protein